MKEDFLHYLWRNKKFDSFNLKTINGEKVEILNLGSYLQSEGPDFFNAQIIIGSQKWAGNVEIHLKSSDWYLHHHETDGNYDNVILHVVWEHDVDVYRKDNSIIPVLELKNYVAEIELKKHDYLFQTKNWINCEKEIHQVDAFVFQKWKERLFLERLEMKINPINDFLLKNSNDWEATLFVFLSKYFGLNINGDSFFQIAKNIPFSIIRKKQNNLIHLEALLFGVANLLNEEKEDSYYRQLQENWNYLKVKYNLNEEYYNNVQFYKLRPDNFPTIRLSQLAAVYATHSNLFTKITTIESLKDFYELLNVSASDYWKTHYVFDKESKAKSKKLSKSFINLLIINVVVPIKFLFLKQKGEDNLDDLIELLYQLPTETNTIIDKFKNIAIPSNSAFDSQTLIQLKNEYCSQKKCLNCSIGLSLLK